MVRPFGQVVDTLWSWLVAAGTLTACRLSLLPLLAVSLRLLVDSQPFLQQAGARGANGAKILSLK